ncbi:oxygenase MpaB family protein [Luteimonas fraxinea]|uniref:oxygenase MpaB family protein n=1 Tax=Luteimonas fraxinea TaxID=2901869 RepID=UPI001E2B57AB|nr:oxygenase MpaB family protein [Luteimonas fraxinea]MCD9124709.1 oxygenase MpaB family protein [Luteimonas fraxinea]
MSSPLTAPLAVALRRWVLGVFPRGQSGIDYDAPAGDPGLFGPDSGTWRVHADFPGMLAGGLCALMLQALHPQVLAGVWDHSDFRDDLVGRLRRTTGFVAGTSFAGTAEAERLITRVRTIHTHVRGTTADGTPYAANDPALLSWVHASEAYAFLQGFRTYAGVEMPVWAQDRYYAEGHRVAAALGAIEIPASRAAMAAYFDAVRPALRYDDRAREVLQVLSRIRLPVPGATLSRGLFLGAGAALLPPWAERMLGITTLQRARHRACARALRGLAPLFHIALPDGAGARACRRVGVSPSILRTWPPPEPTSG